MTQTHLEPNEARVLARLGRLTEPSVRFAVSVMTLFTVGSFAMFAWVWGSGATSVMEAAVFVLSGALFALAAAMFQLLGTLRGILEKKGLFAGEAL